MSLPRSKSQNDVEAVRLDIEQRGARIAYEALLDVCQDKKAPAQAKAAAGVAVLRAGGLYDAKRRPTLEDDPAEMSADELTRGAHLIRAELERVQAELAERATHIESSVADDEEDVNVDVFA